MRRVLAAAGFAVLVTLPGCTGNPAVSDTGYLGTWSRGSDRLISVISIARVGDEYRFRWGKRSEDDRLVVTCGWDGACVELFDGNEVARYQFRAWHDPESGHLKVECTETRRAPTDFRQHFVDELVVSDGGTVLWSYTIERDGETFELKKGPRRSFRKVGDGVVDPPAPAQGS